MVEKLCVEGSVCEGTGSVAMHRMSLKGKELREDSRC